VSTARPPAMSIELLVHTADPNAERRAADRRAFGVDDR